MLSAIHIADLREQARKRLPQLVFDYLDGAAEDEKTLAANRAAFDQWALMPRYLRDVSQRNHEMELLGQTWAQPFGIAPIGMAGLFWPGGDIAAAKAAAKAQVPYVLSTAASSTLPETDLGLIFQITSIRKRASAQGAGGALVGRIWTSSTLRGAPMGEVACPLDTAARSASLGYWPMSQ